MDRHWLSPPRHRTSSRSLGNGNSTPHPIPCPVIESRGITSRIPPSRITPIWKNNCHIIRIYFTMKPPVETNCSPSDQWNGGKFRESARAFPLQLLLTHSLVLVHRIEHWSTKHRAPTTIITSTIVVSVPSINSLFRTFLMAVIDRLFFSGQCVFFSFDRNRNKLFFLRLLPRPHSLDLVTDFQRMLHLRSIRSQAIVKIDLSSMNADRQINARTLENGSIADKWAFSCSCHQQQTSHASLANACISTFDFFILSSVCSGFSFLIDTRAHSIAKSKRLLAHCPDTGEGWDDVLSASLLHRRLSTRWYHRLNGWLAYLTIGANP